MLLGIASGAGRFSSTLGAHDKVSEVSGKCTGTVSSFGVYSEGDSSQPDLA
jgi:hypothetical protein